VPYRNRLPVAATCLALLFAGAGLPAAAFAAPLKKADAAKPAKPAEEPLAFSEAAVQVAEWAVASGDNRGLPFAVIDKSSAQVLVFSSDGRLKGAAPVLLGSAVGDHSAPGVGELELASIPPEARTTPAGRFLAGWGPATGGKTVFWVDYDTAVSLHPVAETNREEKREQRLASPGPDDNRITYGCINVSAKFYRKVVRPTFKGTYGVVYVLPDTMPLKRAIPGFKPQRKAEGLLSLTTAAAD